MQTLFQQPHVSPPLQVVNISLMAQAVGLVQNRHDHLIRLRSPQEGNGLTNDGFSVLVLCVQVLGLDGVWY